MTDFQDDIECLKIHLGRRDSTSSDSGDDDFDEEYLLVRPPPIPADIIRQNSIYRPPSPREEVVNCNLSDLCGSSEVYEAKDSVKNLHAVDEKEKPVGLFAGVIRILSLHLNVANDLIIMKNELDSVSEKLCLEYLDVLEKFQIDLDAFGNSFEDSNFKKLISMVPSELWVDSTISIEGFNVILSNLYAFIISECLLILKASAGIRKSMINSIVVKTLDLIKNIGDIEEIKKKIYLRSFKVIDNPCVHNLLSVQLSNDDIISELIPLASKINKKRRERNNINHSSTDS